MKKFDNASQVEELVWMLRLADLPRDEQRAILERLYNGDPPYSEEEAEENNVQINRNDLSGVNMLTQARRQWYSAMLTPGNFFSSTLDSGPSHKRTEWSHSVTRNANRVLKRSRAYKEQERGVGANTVLHGIGPAVWKDRRSPVCSAIPVSSVMIPSETTVDFENLEYIAFFREWTPAQLWEMTNGLKRDPGWNMNLVQAQWEYVRDQVQKQPNATAFQYMPTRIESLAKQDVGYFGSDAVPTIDVWDFLFRQQEDGGWYRRIILDWGVTRDGDRKPRKGDPVPKTHSNGKFLYTSNDRVYAKKLNEVVHFQFGDCSAVAPFRYHSVRSLGWMLWGIADLENRLHCRFSENVFSNLLWFFQVAGNNDLVRLKKAEFMHMGVIPQGVNWLKATDRFQPNPELINMGFQRFKTLMAENAAAFTQDFDRGASGKEMTATETMARVNSVNALVSGMLTLAYDYEEDKDREVMRRLCIKNNPDPMAQKFRKMCLEDGVPPDMLDVDRMDITRERVMGGGNKTLEMAQVQFLQQVRKNLGPDAQRRVDHISIESATDNADLAEELAPVAGQKSISTSSHDAELATDRIMRGLPYISPADAVPEDYVKTWLMDLATMINVNVSSGGMAKPEEISGYQNMAKQIDAYLKIMSSDQDEMPKVKVYEKNLSDLMNHVKSFEQRLAAQAKAASKNGNGGIDAAAIGKIQSATIVAKNKAQLASQSHAQKTAQRQVSFDLEQQRKEREANAEMRRSRTQNMLDMVADHAKKMTVIDVNTPTNGHTGT